MRSQPAIDAVLEVSCGASAGIADRPGVNDLGYRIIDRPDQVPPVWCPLRNLSIAPIPRAARRLPDRPEGITADGLVCLDELLSDDERPSWIKVVQFFAFGEFCDERYLIKAMYRFLITSDHKRLMRSNHLNVTKILNGNYPSNSRIPARLKRDWNDKLGFLNFSEDTAAETAAMLQSIRQNLNQDPAPAQAPAPVVLPVQRTDGPAEWILPSGVRIRLFTPDLFRQLPDNQVVVSISGRPTTVAEVRRLHNHEETRGGYLAFGEPIGIETNRPGRTAPIQPNRNRTHPNVGVDDIPQMNHGVLPPESPGSPGVIYDDDLVRPNEER
jgi:hypothetical protein